MSNSDWKVTFEGGFWSKRGSAGEEVKINGAFTWGEEKWLVPSMYVFNQGLVADYCVEIDPKKVNAFIDKWQLRDGGFECYSREEQDRIQSEQPLNVCFKSSLICNGIQLESRGGSSVPWLPDECLIDEETHDSKVESVIEHYGLDKSKVWVLWRCSYGWTERQQDIESLEIGFEREAKRMALESLGELELGTERVITHPVTGEKHTLTVLDVIDKEYDPTVFRNPGMEFPTHLQAIEYSLVPDVGRMEFSLYDMCEGDSPRAKDDNHDGPVAMSVSILSGAQKGKESCEQGVRTACSAVHFDKNFEVNWVPVFQVKEMDDKVFRYVRG